ncbi:autophagy protein Apg9-domain-containing protein, partial [Blyttiomyces helicus]
IENDTFFRQLYDYYLGSGFVCIILSEVCSLLTYLFTITFSTFLATCVDWETIHKTEQEKQVFYTRCMPPQGRNSIVTFSFSMFMIGFSIHAIRRVFYICEMYQIRDVWIGELCLPANTKWVTWQMVIDKYKCKVDGNADEHYIVNRIMRWDNYFIAMLSKNILSLENYSGTLFTKFKEWNLKAVITHARFRSDGILIKDVLKSDRDFEYSQRLRKTFIWYGVINLVLAPFAMCALIVYFIYRYVGEYHRNPKAMGSYAFSPLARWKVRNFNELPHDYVTRLNKIHPRIIEYLAQFSNESWNIISKFVSFVLGATLLITLIVSFFNPELTLSLFLADKPLIFYAGIFGTIYVAIGNTEYVKIYKPDEKYTELISLLDPTPFYGTSPWETMNTSERYAGIRKLFNYRWLVFLHEIISVIYVPFILVLQLPDKSKDIVNFFRDNSHDDKDLGVVCTYGIF